MREDGARVLSQHKAAALSGPAPCKLRGKVPVASLHKTGCKWFVAYSCSGRGSSETTDLERFKGNSESRQTLFDIVTEFRRADQIARDVLVRHVRRLLAALGKRAKFAAPEPHEPYQIQLLVVIERGQRRFEFLQRRVAASLQDIHLLIIGGIRSRLGVGSSHPVIKKLDDAELLNVIKHLRDRRNRAREFGRYKRRELRGQTAPSGLTMASGSAASESDGHRAKRTLLSAALKRANKEAERRRTTNVRSALVSNVKRALPLKKVADIGTAQPSMRSATQDMQPIPNTDISPLGTLTQKAQRPVLERSHKVR
jgi:hypothetical protein